MKKVFVLLAVSQLFLACGYRSKDSELIGQVKKFLHHTPIICSDYHSIELSLGYVKNGVGSMSNEDVELYIPEHLVQTFKEVSSKSSIAKFTYDHKRISFCVPPRQVTKIEIVE